MTERQEIILSGTVYRREKTDSQIGIAILKDFSLGNAGINVIHKEIKVNAKQKTCSLLGCIKSAENYNGEKKTSFDSGINTMETLLWP